MTKPQDPAEALMQMNVIADAVVGYRQKLVDGGVPPTTADQMALEYHTAMMELLKMQASGKSGVRR
jgi:hypothetical protein